MEFNIESVRSWLRSNERSAAWLAGKARLGKTTMKRLMTGKEGSPRLDTIGAIARVTGLRIVDLVVESHDTQAKSA